jgi:hypothetical protein
MAAWQDAATAAPARAPARPPRSSTSARAPRLRPKGRAAVAGGLAWIVVAGVLLAGIVALNVAVLRLNVKLDHLNNERDRLRAKNAALASELSSAASSPRIQGLATARGFVPADPQAIGYVDLTPRRER